MTEYAIRLQCIFRPEHVQTALFPASRTHAIDVAISIYSSIVKSNIFSRRSTYDFKRKQTTRFLELISRNKPMYSTRLRYAIRGTRLSLLPYVHHVCTYIVVRRRRVHVYYYVLRLKRYDEIATNTLCSSTFI